MYNIENNPSLYRLYNVDCLDSKTAANNHKNFPYEEQLQIDGVSTFADILYNERNEKQVSHGMQHIDPKVTKWASLSLYRHFYHTKYEYC